MNTKASTPPAPADSDSMPLAIVSQRMRFLRFLPFMVFALSLTVTYQLWQRARQDVIQELQGDFEKRVSVAATSIEERMATYEQVLRGTKGLFAASGSVERNEFHEYVNALHLEENYPGIQGVGFALIVPPEQKSQHIGMMRSQGFSDYTIHPEGAREIYTSVIYLEPFDERNRRAFGYDMYSDREHPREGDSVPGVRRAAMERARDSGRSVISGKSAISGKVRLLMEMETDEQMQAGFLMYLPIYKNGAPPDTLDARRASITGWVYAPFRMDNLMEGIFGSQATELDIQIYDGDELSEQALMYDSSRHDSELVPLFRTVQPLVITDQRWTAVIHSLPVFDARLTGRPGFEGWLDNTGPQIVLNAGIGISLLLTLFVWMLVRDQQRTLQEAEYLAQSEAQLQEMFENMSSGVVVYQASSHGRDFTIATLNKAAERIEKVSREEVIGNYVTKAFPGISKIGLLDVFRRVWNSGVAEHLPAAFYQDERISGWRENYVYKLRCGRIVTIYDDVTARKQEEERVRHLVHHDALTGLPNRVLIDDRIQQAFVKARRDRTRMALLFVDLDRFKLVNDKYGHDVGDRLLQEAAKRLQNCMRESDTAARTGGDEFIVLLPTIETEHDAMVVAEKICDAFRQPFELVVHRLTVSCSIGMAIFPEHGIDEKQLLKHADLAMYHAKQSGRDNVKVFRAGMQDKK